VTGECVKVRAGEILFEDDAPEPTPLPPAWPFAALRDLGAQLAAANSKLANVAALIAKAKAISPSDRMTLMVGDVEFALGLRDEPARTRTGANDEGTAT
jgi:hypothetical protein